MQTVAPERRTPEALENPFLEVEDPLADRDLLTWVDALDLQQLIREIGPESADALVAMMLDCEERGREYEARARVIKQHLTTLLEYANNGEKAALPGEFLDSSGRRARFTLTYKPSAIERKWKPDTGRVLFMRLQADDNPAIRELAQKHFREEVVCKHAGHARSAIAPLGGEIGALFGACFEETPRPPTLAVEVTALETPEE